MKKLDPTTKNKIMNLVLTAKKDRSALIIKERDKWFTERNLKEIRKQYPCKGILVKSTQAGTAYCLSYKGRKSPEPISDDRHVYGNDLFYASVIPFTEYDRNKYEMYEIRYAKGTLQIMVTFDEPKPVRPVILVRPDQIIDYEIIR
ncbi:MAG: hypothetical protein HDQ88_07785 [Clostridia bacterium]|nr:hypothetical protein [Clostridia bacterium]